MTHHPKFSIVVAVRNGAATIQRLIDSCDVQTNHDWQLLIIDGQSTDGTVEILKKNGRAIAHWESGPDTGIYNAWNKALPYVNGEWVCFLGADDRFAGPNALASIAARLSGIPAAIRVVYGQVQLVDGSGNAIDLLGTPWPVASRRFTQLMSIPHPGTLHHRSLFEQHGPFDESFRIAGDYEFLLRELLTHDACFLDGMIIAEMTVGGVSSRPENFVEQLHEVRAAQRKHGILRPGTVWRSALLRAHLRVLSDRFLGDEISRWLADGFRLVRGKRRFWTGRNAPR